MTEEDPYVPAAIAAARLGIPVEHIARRIEARIMPGQTDASGRCEVPERAIQELLELRTALRRSASLPGAPPPMNDEERGRAPSEGEERARVWREVLPRRLRALAEGRVMVWTAEVAQRLRRRLFPEEDDA